jgi:GT2 family glycosyltransferase
MDVTAVVLAYGDQPVLDEVIDALFASQGVEVEVVLVDNGCTSQNLGSLPPRDGLTVLTPGLNTGFTGGCNLGARSAKAPVLAFVNSDAVVHPDALAELVRTVSRPDVGIAMASLRLAENPDLMNSAGNPLHVLGLSWAGALGEPASAYQEERPVPSASGAAIALRREVWDALGGFTEPFFAYSEDADLSLRCWQLGWRVVFVPTAVVVHHYEFSRNPAKFYLLERNRLAMLLTVYGTRTLLLLAPVLLAFELAMCAVSAADGWFRDKLRGYVWLLRNRRWLAERRRAVQGVRVRSDRELAGLLTAAFDQSVLPLPVGGSVLDRAMRSYWGLTRRLL